MAVLKLSTPGVYVQEIPSIPPSVAEVETAIPAFIGYTEKADSSSAGDLKMMPTKINSFDEFEHYYGKAPEEADNTIFIKVSGSLPDYDVTIDYKETDTGNQHNLAPRSKHNLHASVRHFYDNGGGTCYVVSVNTYAVAAGAIKEQELIDGLKVLEEVDEVTILSIPEASKIDDPQAAIAAMAANPPVPPAAYKNIVNALIAHASHPDRRDRFALIDPFWVTPESTTNPNGKIDDDVKIIRESTLGVTENRFAAAYYPNLITSYSYYYNYEKIKINDGPAGIKDKKISDLVGSALYNKIAGMLKKQYLVLPPSPSIAGLYTRVDNTKGVWKAPANEVLSFVVKPQVDISHREQQNLNVDPNAGKSINVIRTFPGYGVLVWGARTLNGNDNEWRYVSVRRFFNMVEESIKKSIQWAVFEPNTSETWVRVRGMVENYLSLKWREGALAGAKAEQAYYVRVGIPATMTSLDVLEGRMIVEIGMAVARPAEFIVLKFVQMMQQS